VKNAPAVTARRATNQIVLVGDHQALAAIAAAALVAIVLAVTVLAVTVLAEQTVRVETMRLIDHAVTATGHTHHARLVTEIRVLAGMATIVLAIRVATAIPLPGRLARLVTAHTQLDPHVMEIVRIRLDPHVTAILRVGLRVPGETAPIRRARRATARVQIVREAIVQIVHAPIVLTAISRAVNGSPMEEIVVRSARR
jgi:hypothetical protein